MKRSCRLKPNRMYCASPPVPRDPGLFLPRLRKDTTVLDGQPGRAGPDDDKHALGRDIGDPRGGSGDFGD